MGRDGRELLEREKEGIRNEWVGWPRVGYEGYENTYLGFLACKLKS